MAETPQSSTRAHATTATSPAPLSVDEFSAHGFDAVAWVNKHAESLAGGGEVRESALSTLLVQLQLLVQDEIRGTETAAQVLSRRIPQAATAVQKISSECRSLRESAARVLDKVENLASSDSATLDLLERTHEIREKLRSTTESVQAVEALTSTFRKLEEDIAHERPLRALAAQVDAASSELERMRGVLPEVYEKNATTLAERRREMSERAVPQLEAALADRSVARARDAMEVLRLTEGNDGSNARQVFVACRSAQWERTWSRRASTAKRTIAEALYDLVDDVLREVQADIAFLGGVVRDPSLFLDAAVSQVLRPICEGLANADLDDSGAPDAALDALQAVRRCCDLFANSHLQLAEACGKTLLSIAVKTYLAAERAELVGELVRAHGVALHTGDGGALEREAGLCGERETPARTRTLAVTVARSWKAARMAAESRCKDAVEAGVEAEQFRAMDDELSALARSMLLTRAKASIAARRFPVLSEPTAFWTEFADIVALAVTMSQVEGAEIAGEICSSAASAATKPVRDALERLCKSKRIITGDEAREDTDVGGERVGQLPSFSLSPSEEVTSVGEWLFAAPQHLEEQYCNAAADSVVDEESPRRSASGEKTASAGRQTMPSASSRSSDAPSAGADEDDFLSSGDEEGSDIGSPGSDPQGGRDSRRRTSSLRDSTAAAEFVAIWLAAIAGEVATAFRSACAGITECSKSGLAQLEEDTRHLRRVLAAVGSDAGVTLTEVASALEAARGTELRAARGRELLRARAGLLRRALLPQ